MAGEVGVCVWWEGVDAGMLVCREMERERVGGGGGLKRAG